MIEPESLVADRKVLCMAIKNRISEYEKEICSILAHLAYHLDPRIIERIQEQNAQEYDYFKDLFDGKIEVDNYLFDGSACVFPGVRRYVSAQGKKRAYNIEYNAIIDDNTFPRHIWCFLENGKIYSGPNWKTTGLNEFELAHVFTHKESELDFEKPFFSTLRSGLYPYGNFSCACNVVLLPKGAVRPTDNSMAVKAAFYKRYIDLYGETPLNGRSGFDESLVPRWYGDLNWNEPELPDEWESKIDKLLKYRTHRITHILNR